LLRASMEEPYASSCVAFTSSTIALGSLRPDKAKSATGDSVLFSAAVRQIWTPWRQWRRS